MMNGKGQRKQGSLFNKNNDSDVLDDIIEQIEEEEAGIEEEKQVQKTKRKAARRKSKKNLDDYVDAEPADDDDEQSEMEKFEEDADETILSDYDHRVYLLATKHLKDLKKIQNVLNRDLAISKIDAEFAYIFSLRIQCIEEWIELGLYQFALKRMVSLVARLNLMRSIDGFERILQSNNGLAGSIDLTPIAQESLNYNRIYEEEEQQGRGGEGGIESIKNKIRSLKKYNR